MRRRALSDFQIRDQTIRAGDKGGDVVRLEAIVDAAGTAIERPDNFIIDRARPRQHLSFGFGIHLCVGNRLAEMQLQIVWEEGAETLAVRRDRWRAAPRPVEFHQRLRDIAGEDSGALAEGYVFSI